MNERLAKAIDDRADDLVALTADLIRFPTVNPPGEAYAPCAEYIAARLRRRGFGIELVRGEGTPGDTDRYPRTNVIARFDGRSARRRRCISTRISTWSSQATAGASTRSPASSATAASMAAAPAT